MLGLCFLWRCWQLDAGLSHSRQALYHGATPLHSALLVPFSSNIQTAGFLPDRPLMSYKAFQFKILDRTSVHTESWWFTVVWPESEEEKMRMDPGEAETAVCSDGVIYKDKLLQQTWEQTFSSHRPPQVTISRGRKVQVSTREFTPQKCLRDTSFNDYSL